MKVQIFVHPNSKHPRIQDCAGVLHVYVKALAKEGKANEGVRIALAKHFDTPKSLVKLLHGEKSKTKLFQIDFPVC